MISFNSLHTYTLYCIMVKISKTSKNVYNNDDEYDDDDNGDDDDDDDDGVNDDNDVYEVTSKNVPLDLFPSIGY